MTTRLRLLTVILLLSTAALAANSTSTTPQTPAAEAFARLKSLAGTWQAESSMGKIETTYEVVSGGSVLLERITGPHETPMITAYHLNGDKLELTHYCELGNQPHMIAKSINLDSGEIAFDFAGAGNLASPNAQHMHSAKVRLVDNDHFTADWTLFENAKPKLTMNMQYVRVK
jgi:hypothetical protein